MLPGLLFISALACGTPKQSASSALEENQAVTPREFAPGVVSTGHEFGISFTPDGMEAYFSRFAAKQPIHIFRTRFVNGSWQEPDKLSLSSEDWSDLDPFVSPDGKKLFFVSTRSEDRSVDSRGKKNMDVWVAVRTGTEWSTPHRVENVNSSSKEGSHVSRKAELCISSLIGKVAPTRTQFMSRVMSAVIIKCQCDCLPQSTQALPTRVRSFHRMVRRYFSIPLVPVAWVKQICTSPREGMEIGP